METYEYSGLVNALDSGQMTGDDFLDVIDSTVAEFLSADSSDRCRANGPDREKQASEPGSAK